MKILKIKLNQSLQVGDAIFPKGIYVGILARDIPNYMRKGFLYIFNLNGKRTIIDKDKYEIEMELNEEGLFKKHEWGYVYKLGKIPKKYLGFS